METARTLVTRDNIRIAYQTTRTGTPRRTLVLLHGLASNMTRWSEFVATTSLIQNWDLLRLDLRGHGGSVCRTRADMDVWSDDVAELLRAEGAARAVLVGHCLGANLALRIAARRPELVAALVLIEPMFRQCLSGRMRAVAALRPLLSALVPFVLRLADWGLHRRRVDTIDLAELDRQARAAMADGGAFPAGRYASVVEDLRTMPTSMFLQDLVAVTGPLPLPRIRVPVLALLSTGGAFGDPARTKHLLADLPGCRVELIDALHWIPTEQPAAMAAAIEGWCGEQSPATP